jgi:hypothetical protein
VRRVIIVVGVVLACAAWARPAAASIDVNKSIAGVSPGMTRAEVEARLGKPVVTWAHDSRGNLVPGVIAGGSPLIGMSYRPVGACARRGARCATAGSIAIWWRRTVVPRAGGGCRYPAGSQRRNQALLAKYVRCALRAIPMTAPIWEIDAATGSKERTTGSPHVGVGSTYTQVKAALAPWLRNGLQYGECRYRGGRGARALCFVNSIQPNLTRTRFLFNDRRRPQVVTSVEMEAYGSCAADDGCAPPLSGSGQPGGSAKATLNCDRDTDDADPGGFVCTITIGSETWGGNEAEIYFDTTWTWGDGETSDCELYRCGGFGHVYASSGTYAVQVSIKLDQAHGGGLLTAATTITST